MVGRRRHRVRPKGPPPRRHRTRPLHLLLPFAAALPFRGGRGRRARGGDTPHMTRRKSPRISTPGRWPGCSRRCLVVGKRRLGGAVALAWRCWLAWLCMCFFSSLVVVVVHGDWVGWVAFYGLLASSPSFLLFTGRRYSITHHTSVLPPPLLPLSCLRSSYCSCLLFPSNPYTCILLSYSTFPFPPTHLPSFLFYFASYQLLAIFASTSSLTRSSPRP